MIWLGITLPRNWGFLTAKCKTESPQIQSSGHLLGSCDLTRLRYFDAVAAECY